jgi:hypothetical protein
MPLAFRIVQSAGLFVDFELGISRLITAARRILGTATEVSPQVSNSDTCTKSGKSLDDHAIAGHAVALGKASNTQSQHPGHLETVKAVEGYTWLCVIDKQVRCFDKRDPFYEFTVVFKNFGEAPCQDVVLTITGAFLECAPGEPGPSARILNCGVIPPGGSRLIDYRAYCFMLSLTHPEILMEEGPLNYAR